MPDSAADTVLRMALGMFAIATDSPCTDAQRQWIVQRLQSLAPLTLSERAAIKQPLLEWYRKAYPRSYAIVAQQFGEESTDAHNDRPSTDTATATRFRAGRVSIP